MSHLKFSDSKYSGELVNDIILKDPSYCHYLVHFSKNYIPKDIRDLLFNKFPNKDDYFMSFGPFKTKSLTWIQANEPEYIDYLLNDKFVQTKCFKLIEKLKML